MMSVMSKFSFSFCFPDISFVLFWFCLNTCSIREKFQYREPYSDDQSLALLVNVRELFGWSRHSISLDSVESGRRASSITSRLGS